MCNVISFRMFVINTHCNVLVGTAFPDPEKKLIFPLYFVTRFIMHRVIVRRVAK